MTNQEQPNKMEVVKYFLEKEGRVMLCVDASFPGVEVPRRFAGDKGLRLILSVRMPQPIEIGSETIESELRFNGIPHYCILPYGAMWGAYNPDSGHGLFWPADMPLEIRDSYEAQGYETRIPPGLRPQGRKSGGKSSGKPQLQVIDGGGEVEEKPAEEGETPPPPPRRPQLRLVE
ncbi:MAG: hypothetical protein G8345_22260 [Magnetococcales bacterium]|nr:hypothetical protein [Magnetococcales bacterium]NGZ29600.1 hypothetical protein [Magnetococcales bacterium]